MVRTASRRFVVGAGVFSAAFLVVGIASAYVGPTQSPPAGFGGIRVNNFGTVPPNVIYRLGIGGDAQLNMKVLIVGENGDTYPFVVRNSASDIPILSVVRATGIGLANAKVGIATTTPTSTLTVDGDLTVTGNIYGTFGTGGTFLGSIPAENVISGVFGVNTASGTPPYAFRGNVGIGTATQVGLPQMLSVYGGAYVQNVLAIGTTTPAATSIFEARDSFADIFRIDNAGRVAIGGGGDPAGNKLTVHGTLGFGYQNNAWWTSGNIPRIYSSQSGGSYPFGSQGNLIFQSRVDGPSEFIFANGQGGPSVIARLDASTGNFGIGPAAPAYRLDVQGGARVTDLRIATTSVAGYAWKATDALGNGSWQPDSTGGLTGGQTNYLARWTSASSLGTSTLFQNGVNMGINNTSAAYTLDVGGTVNATGLRVPTGAVNGYVLKSDASGNATWQIDATGLTGGQTNYIPRWTSATTQGTSTISQNGANIGVNNASAAYTLDVGGTVNATGLRMPTGASAGSVLTSDAAGVGTWQVLPAAQDLRWVSSGANMYSSTTITNIGIGSIAPDTKLHVQNNSGDNILKLARTNTTSTIFRVGTDGTLVIQNQATDAVAVTTDGLVGIRTNAPTYTLDVNGRVNGSQTNAVRVRTNSPAGTEVSISDDKISLRNTLDQNNYPYIEWVGHDGQRGGFLGWGNPPASSPTDRYIDFRLENGTNLYISRSSASATGGNLGIGINPINYTLDVNGTSTGAFRVQTNNNASTSFSIRDDSFILQNGMNTANFPTISWRDYNGTTDSYLGWGNPSSVGPTDKYLEFAFLNGLNLYIRRSGTSGGNIGIRSTNPAEALTIGDGNLYVASSTVANPRGLILKATDGANCYLVTVNNAGTLATTAVTCPMY